MIIDGIMLFYSAAGVIGLASAVVGITNKEGYTKIFLFASMLTFILPFVVFYYLTRYQDVSRLFAFLIYLGLYYYVDVVVRQLIKNKYIDGKPRV